MNKRPLRTALAASAFAALCLAAAACTASPPAARTADKTLPAPTTGTPTAQQDEHQPIRTPRDPALDADLLRAAASNDAATVRELVARGADIESRGDHDRTPLIAATKNRATAAARVLIEAGADVNAKDDLEDSAYLYAGAEGLDDILEMTLRNGADLRSTNRYGGTALIPASEHGYVATVRMLIEAGVEVDHINKPHWTALHEAIVYGDGSERYQQVVTALLDAGADPSIRDGAGRTALANAQRCAQTAIVSILRGHA